MKRLVMVIALALALTACGDEVKQTVNTGPPTPPQDIKAASEKLATLPADESGTFYAVSVAHTTNDYPSFKLITRKGVQLWTAANNCHVDWYQKQQWITYLNDGAAVLVRDKGNDQAFCPEEVTIVG